MKDKLYMQGREIGANDVFETWFHTSFRGNRLYLIARSDTGMIIMPETGSRIYATASRYNIVQAKCRLKKIVQTNRNTAFAVVEVLEWQPLI